MQEQMSAEEWWREKYRDSDKIDFSDMQAYADYVQQFKATPPLIVKEAIEKEYRIDQQDHALFATYSLKEIAEYKREAAAFGYNLVQRVDWEKLKKEWDNCLPVGLSQLGANKVFDFFKQRLSLQEGDGWISVEDRLPKKFLNVLVTDGTQYGISCVGNNGSEIDNYPFGDTEVTHWQPLPTFPNKQK